MAFTVPDFTLPGFIARLGQHLPQWPHGLHLCVWLNAALKLRLIPADALEALEGKHFRVTVQDTGGQADFTYRQGLFRPCFGAIGTPDLAFSARLATYLKLLARQEDPDTLFFNRSLEIVGDTELGVLVKNTLDAIEWPTLGNPATMLPGLLSRLLHG